MGEHYNVIAEKKTLYRALQKNGIIEGPSRKHHKKENFKISSNYEGSVEGSYEKENWKKGHYVEEF